MGVIQYPTPIPATVGNKPNLRMMTTTDSLATITAAGYLGAVNMETATPLSNNDVILCLYNYNVNTNAGTFAILTVSISTSTGQITLSNWGDSGGVVLPTIANHIATYTNVNGTLSEDPTTAISAGNIQAGLSGTAGTLASFPGTAAKGSLVLAAVANTGNTATTISNAAMGQASVISIPDPGGATADFALAPAALVNNNIIKASGTAGLIADSGIAASSLPTFTSPTIANHMAVFTNTSGNLGEDAATAINGGNIQAGLSGTAGTVASFPGTAGKGSLALAAVANTGNTVTTISNAAMGQASVISIPDPAGATANFAVAPAALVNNNLVKASGTAGLVADAGIATSNVMVLNAVNTMTGSGSIVAVKANGTEAANAVTASGMAGTLTTSSLTTGGGMIYSITWTNTYISGTSSVLLTIAGGTNTTDNISIVCVPGSGVATIQIINNTAATGLNGTIKLSYLVI